MSVGKTRLHKKQRGDEQARKSSARDLHCRLGSTTSAITLIGDIRDTQIGVVAGRDGDHDTRSSGKHEEPLAAITEGGDPARLPLPSGPA